MRPWLAWALLALGLGQMAADMVGQPLLTGLFFATAASPAPKVFSALSGYEPFSSQFVFEAMRDGKIAESVVFTPELYDRIPGPYNRRNAFGAVFAGGPVLNQSPLTAPMIDSVLRYGLCGANPLLAGELGLPQGDHYRLRVIPKFPVKIHAILEAPCSR